MTYSNQVPPRWHAVLSAALLCLLTACGGGSGGASVAAAGGDPIPQDCLDDCGIVYVGLTDADGDYLRYELDVLSLTLERSDGTIIETLPLRTRVDFAQYVDLTEFLTAATAPPGVYTSSTITVDYRGAEVLVEKDGVAVEATVQDPAGLSPGRISVPLELDTDIPLRVRPGLPSWITLDFDLQASNTVDLTVSPPIVTADPFLIADPDLFDEKTRRARGPLLEVDVSASNFQIVLRPFRMRAGDFGRLAVQAGDDTTFEIDGEMYAGGDGLRALEALGAGTPTLSVGVVNRADRVFRASEIYAGSSVPGASQDAARGYVLARDGDELTLRAAVVERMDDGLALYRDRLTVLLTDATRVLKARHPDEALETNVISPAQRVQVLGQLEEADDGSHTLIASVVRMIPSHLAGAVNTAQTGYLSMDLQTIGNSPATEFDFSGTGISEEFDAVAEDYELATGDLNTVGLESGTPVKAAGFGRPFGMAPEDFDAFTLADFAASRARLVFGWVEPGSVSPFLSIGNDGLVLDPDDPTLGERHHVAQAGIHTDVLAAGVPPTVLPDGQGRGLYAIGAGHHSSRPRRVAIYADFADFTQALAEQLDGEQTLRGLYGIGYWGPATAEFSAARLIAILGP